MYAFAVHGGAGAAADGMDPRLRADYRAGLEAARDAGYDVLARGGCALDAVTAGVRALEDDPLFNAGRGAALARDGWAELDAAIMDGRQQRAGAVAACRHVKNPVELARCVMERSPHVLLVGAGAQEMALEQGLALAPNEYFRTPQRRRQLDRLLAGETDSAVLPAGTVGAVALDGAGNLAAATSTGGTALKRPGRVGDSPLIGAGTYARNGVCAVSATGQGEYFIRAVAAYHVCAAVEYRGLSLERAVAEVLHEKIRALGGTGGMIAIDAHGRIVADFSAPVMLRAARDSRGRREVALD